MALSHQKTQERRARTAQARFIPPSAEMKRLPPRHTDVPAVVYLLQYVDSCTFALKHRFAFALKHRFWAERRLISIAWQQRFSPAAPERGGSPSLPSIDVDVDSLCAVRRRETGRKAQGTPPGLDLTRPEEALSGGVWVFF